MQLLGLAGAELPGVGEVLDAAHAEAGADDVGELGVLGGDDEVAGPHQHEPGGVDVAVHLGDGDLAQVAPPPGVLEEVVPLLEHPVLGALAGAAVDRRTSGAGSGPGVRSSIDVLRAHVVAGGEHRPDAAEDHDPDVVVGLGAEEGVVELDSRPRFWALRVSGRFSMMRAIVPSSSVS